MTTDKCTAPPPGWTCSRKPGHEGPCAASPVKLPWLCRIFGHAYRLPPGMYVFGQDYLVQCKRCGAEDECSDFWVERS